MAYLEDRPHLHGHRRHSDKLVSATYGLSPPPPRVGERDVRVEDVAAVRGVFDAVLEARGVCDGVLDGVL